MDLSQIKILQNKGVILIIVIDRRIFLHDLLHQITVAVLGFLIQQPGDAGHLYQIQIFYFPLNITLPVPLLKAVLCGKSNNRSDPLFLSSTWI